MSVGSTLRSATRVALPVRRPRTAPAVPVFAGHALTPGDTLAVMEWESHTYRVVRVTYARPGELVNVVDTMSGEHSSHDWSALMASAGQAYAWSGADLAENPTLGVVTRTAGPAHHITTAGRCHQCRTTGGE